jgi:hypothetical protein
LSGKAEVDVTVTAKLIALLVWPATLTTTFPVVAPAGTVAAMLVALQLVGVAAVPLKVIVLEPCIAPKFVPAMVTGVPTGPELGLKLVMLGAVGLAVTVKVILLLAWPATVTTTLPVVVPAGTIVAMLVALQLVGVAIVPLKVIVLEPCAAPKFVPAMVTGVPTRPEFGVRLVMLGVVMGGGGGGAIIVPGVLPHPERQTAKPAESTNDRTGVSRRVVRFHVGQGAAL